MTLEEASRATKLGGTLAYVCAAVMAGLAIVSIVFPSGGDASGAYGDAWSVLDVVLMLSFGWGVRRYSRAAAVGLLTYFVFSKILQIMNGEARFGILSLVLVYFFYKGIRGTFVYHKIRRKTDPEYRKPGMWPWFVFVPTAFTLVALLVFGVLIKIGHIPDSLVLRGDEVPEATRKTLTEYGLISKEEELLFFYSAGVFSLLEDGNIITNRRVISYEESTSSLDIYSAPFDSILTAVVYRQGGGVEDTIIEITTTDSSNFWLYASKEEGRDKDFLQAIHSRIPKQEADVSFLR